MAISTPDQKAIQIVCLLTEEIVPVIGVLEADWGTNLLAHVMLETCQILGIAKLNTTHSVMAWLRY